MKADILRKKFVANVTLFLLWAILGNWLLPPATADTINVKQFGAPGDGRTDDTIALRTALATAALQKAMVFAPAGDYKITNSLDLLEGQVFFGVGNATRLLAFSHNQTMLNLRGSHIHVRDMFLTTASDVTGVIGVYVNPEGNVHANFNTLGSLRIEGPASGVVIQGGQRIAGADMGAWYNSLVDINMRFVTNGVTLTTHPANLSNGANATRAYNVRVGECGTGWRITRADTAQVFGFAAEGCRTGIHIADAPGADNNSNVFFGPRFEGTTTHIRVDAQSFFNGFVGFEPMNDRIVDRGVATTFLGTCCRIQFDGLSYTNVDAITYLNAGNGVSITGNVGIGVPPHPAFDLDVAGAAHASSFPTSSDARLKTSILPLTNVLQKLEQIRGISFEWNEVYESLGRSTKRREIGVIAQEVENVFPDLVTIWGDAGYRAVDYGRLTGVLIEAIKEIRAERDAHMAALELRLATLEQATGVRGASTQLSFSIL